MKSSILNIRINPNVRQVLLEIAESESLSISDIVRDALESYVKNYSSFNDMSQYEDGWELIQTVSFSELIFWIMDKRFDAEINESESLYKQHHDLIVEMGKLKLFPDDLMFEFDKVRNELSEILFNEQHYLDFKFSTESNGFDYDKLHSFMHIMRYDSNNNRIINIK